MYKTAYIYMDGIGNVCFQIGDLHIEYIASKILTEIKSVIEYDNTGYIVIDTNYGEEFYDLGEEIDDKGLANRFNIKDIMGSIEKWEIKKMANIQSELREQSFLIVDNIAFGIVKNKMNGVNLLRAIDLNNLNYKADFVYDKSINKFNQVSSTFSDGKRKYETLYIVERNTAMLYEEYINA